MLNPPLPLKRLSAQIGNQDALRVIVFEVMDYIFALPIEAVLKIVVCPSLKSPIENGIGIVDLESETIAVVDLRYKFASSSFKEPVTAISASWPRRFLIVTQTRTSEPCGFLVDKSPSLNDVLLSTIRPLPSSYRQVAELGFANRIGELPASGKQSESATVFILG